LTDSEDNEDLAASLARLPEGAGDETMLQVQVQVQVALSRFAALLDPSGEVDF
jgi:hypothetical protein